MINLILIWAFMGFLTAYLSGKRGKNPKLWFWLGILFGLLAIAALYLIPSHHTKKPAPQLVAAAPLPFSEPMEEWYYFDRENRQVGPVGFSEISHGFHKSNLSQESYVWTAGMVEWKRIRELPDLSQRLEK